MTITIDENIKIVDVAICRHIDQFAECGRGEISQDILSHLRNFVEAIMVKIYAQNEDIVLNWESIQNAVTYVKSRGEWKDLTRFHKCLQISVSHYTSDEENSERLMLKYYVYLCKIKDLVHEKLSLDVLSNLNQFPLNTDRTQQEYYEKIATKINSFSQQSVTEVEKYYIQKITPFFVDHQIYYEITFTPANDYVGKSNRVTAFTKLEINDFYAVQFSLSYTSIDLLNKTMPIIIITGWMVAIRDCEFKNYRKIIRGTNVPTISSEQRSLCQFLTETGLNLVELIDFSDAAFQEVKCKVTENMANIAFFNDLEFSRGLIKDKAEGSNLLRYLLYHMNNKVIKNQWSQHPNDKMSGLYVDYGCIPFDRIPFSFSPIGHNPRLGDLFACIDATDRQHEILARIVKNNTEMKGQLFTPLEDLSEFNNIRSLVSKYNDVLYYKHREKSKLVIQNNHIFINGYVDDTRFIVNKLKELAETGLQNYFSSVKSWLEKPNHGVDCVQKKDILKTLFEKSHVALVYGSAGTGKSTLINHIAHFFVNQKKLFLAHTNPAVNNLKRRVTAKNSEFSTITKFLSSSYTSTEYALLVIDECSTVSNDDMRKIATRATNKLLVLVGDSYQIESIQFGNWFSIARTFVPGTSVFELTTPYRSNNRELLELWTRVRQMEDTITELITHQGYSTTLDSSIFMQTRSDEIILCLNYDGLYGINNINRFLQENNPSNAVSWGIHQYKVNDPILFNESNRFAPIIYNNMKGRIMGIEILDRGEATERIQFDIELDKSINGLDADGQDFELLDNGESGNSIIRFCVDHPNSTDEDGEASSKSVVPFQVSYAVSIHKAQGLEYDSVKIVITDEVDELITHNIFYTAITRAKNNLKIYWTPEVENKVLSSIKPKNNNKDVQLLKSLFSELQ